MRHHNQFILGTHEKLVCHDMVLFYTESGMIVYDDCWKICCQK
ncbi:hypothetical protein L313_0035 [Acinetobacter haemolyticus CIP 64.3 = MTCC 9819]|uniref:Uncharacterized protein n=1 Tax=Acinetobacter haemolyticus ATCC 19194 TaxID=707232 RepID=D4XUI8_ACIHA|nr:hypothetical protein HMPREF0023_2241 [Acinetobacter sp. ATCC 27244]EFF81117.1 hypothetical protein HMP0015_3380 [Acinetobacter haemolyticus ATCC 19194]EPR90659.1 hypothetical protein L313_0035 [Acinetobacter haemolyticus CIP 64.3 = MTCC 9819]